jgi:hypothetical protein
LGSLSAALAGESHGRRTVACAAVGCGEKRGWISTEDFREGCKVVYGDASDVRSPVAAVGCFDSGDGVGVERPSDFGEFF